MPSKLSVPRRLRFLHWIDQQSLVLGVVAVIASVVTIAAMGLMHVRESVHNRISSNTQNLATSVGQTVDGLFDMIDVSLMASVDEIKRQEASGKPNSQAINEYLRNQAYRLPHVAFVRSTNAQGDVTYGPDLPAQRINLAHREFFTTLHDTPRAGMFVAKPVIALIAKRPVLTLARRIDRPDGSFGGTVYASIYVDELANLLSSIQLEPGGSIAMRDRDLGLIARGLVGDVHTPEVGSQPLPAALSAALQVNPNVGTYVSDGIGLGPSLRLCSYRRSEKYGFVMLVGIPMAAAYGEWTHQVWLVTGLVMTLSVALIAWAWQIKRSRTQLRHSLEGLQASQAELQTKHGQLKAAEAQQRTLLDSLHTGVMVHGPDGAVLFSNQRACELLGLSKEHIKGQLAIHHAASFVDEWGHPLTLADAPVSQVIATGQPIIEVTLGVKVPKQNWLQWLLVSAFPEFDAQGSLKQVVVNFYDITKRREADERWRFALEGSGDGVWDVNLETGLAAYSYRYEEMLGYAKGEVSPDQSQWLLNMHPDDQPRMQKLFADYLDNPQGAYSAEYRMRCKDGSYKWIYDRGMVVTLGADGKPMRMVGTHTDISHQKAAESRIWSQANFDTLTQLPNRRLFYDRLGMKILKGQRDGDTVALLFIDLDRFKEVNDTMGHQVGDQLLVEAALRIKESVRDYDTVARLGGDEFTVTLAAQNEISDIGAVAEKIIERLSEPFVLDGNECYVSASVGIALYPNDASNVNDLVRNADQALYAAKNAGRKCFRFFTSTMQESAISRMSLVSDLRRALTLNQFEVHYQPIVDLKTGGIRKAEALLRWHHPTRGMVSPALFIALAEDIGAIHEIGDWVFMQAANQVQRWQSLFHPEFQISVNKSPVQFSGSMRGHGMWIDKLTALGISGNSIAIEITEGALMDSNATVTQSLIQFRDAGIQVAIDDFGTGYSSLAYLKKFDIDYLKIDQSFIRNLSPTSSDVALCEAIIVMAHKLGLQVIAEGVETAEQRDLLQYIGCDYAQGYLFSKPIEVQAFETLLAERLGLELTTT